jgi:hypothetical protein
MGMHTPKVLKREKGMLGRDFRPWNMGIFTTFHGDFPWTLCFFCLPKWFRTNHFSIGWC